jgi:16S rRNA G966 N2-methylase RsmD
MLKIKEEFKSLIFKLKNSEYKELEKSCLEYGIRDAIVTWQGYIIDGHNRYEIAQKHNLDYKITEMQFDSNENVKGWMILNQLGRRNLNKYQRSVLALQLEDFLRKKARENLVEGGKISQEGCQISDKAIDTKKELANYAEVSHDTIVKVKKIQEKASDKIKKQLFEGKISINKAEKNITKEEKKKQKEDRINKINEIKLTNNNFIKDIEKGWNKIGNHFLYYGSNLDNDFYNYLPNASLVFADPPYNAGVDDWDYNFKWKQDKFIDKCKVFAVTPGGWNTFSFYKETKLPYVWENICYIKNGMTYGKCGYSNYIKTSIFSNEKVRMSQDLFTITIKINESDDTKHKGRKPYEYMSEILNLFTNEKDYVIDIFAGSGTTLLMCDKMNRISYNAELDKSYCIDIINRGIDNNMKFYGKQF